MKICRFDDNKLGIVVDTVIHDVSAVLANIPMSGYPFPIGDQLIVNLHTLLPAMKELVGNVQTFDVASVRLLSPIANPSKVIGIPVNYHEHVEESRNDKTLSHNRELRPVYVDGPFLKSNSSLVGPAAGVAIRFPDQRTDHEAELAYIIGRRCSNVDAEEALDYVAGYALGLDMVLRGPQDRSLRKSIDSYSVLGPWLVTADEISDPQNLEITFTVNGEVRQQANTGLMLSPIAEQIAWMSTWYDLLPGDIVMSGTPAGVSRVFPGDLMVCSVPEIGAMSVAVSAYTA